MIVRGDWTLEQALTAQIEFNASRGEQDDSYGPWQQWCALQALEDFKARHEAGDEFAFLRAIHRCGQHGLPIPRWAFRRFSGAFGAINRYEVASWDEVLPKLVTTRRKLRAERKKLVKAYSVFRTIREMRKSGRAMDDELLAEAGRVHGIGRTLASEYYAHVKATRPALVREMNRKARS